MVSKFVSHGSEICYKNIFLSSKILLLHLQNKGKAIHLKDRTLLLLQNLWRHILNCEILLGDLYIRWMYNIELMCNCMQLSYGQLARVTILLEDMLKTSNEAPIGISDHNMTIATATVSMAQFLFDFSNNQHRPGIIMSL